MSHPVVDAQAGLAMLGGNKMIYLRLLKTYAAGTLYQDSVDAVLSQDAARAQVALHTLKGATGNLHLTALYEKSKELEGVIKQNGAIPTADQMAGLQDIQEQTMARITEIIADPNQI